MSTTRSVVGPDMDLTTRVQTRAAPGDEKKRKWNKIISWEIPFPSQPFYVHSLLTLCFQARIQISIWSLSIPIFISSLSLSDPIFFCFAGFRISFCLVIFEDLLLRVQISTRILRLWFHVVVDWFTFLSLDLLNSSLERWDFLWFLACWRS